MLLLHQPIGASDRILDRFYIISIEFLSLSHKCASLQSIPSGKEQGEMAVFTG